MARIQCNVISYTLKRTVDINVILPSVSIPEYMVLVIIMHNGVVIPMLSYMLKKEKLLL